jgi:hypothetical protein
MSSLMLVRRYAGGARCHAGNIGLCRSRRAGTIALHTERKSTIGLASLEGDHG